MATATAASNTTETQTDGHPTKTVDSIPATTTKTNDVVSTEKPPVSSTDVKDGDTNLKSEDPAANNNSNKEDGDSVIQKKIRRAERFGMPVQLSEEEKRNSRAERFGATPGSQGSDATKKAEELKRKARAERFGITKSTPAEEDEKKKARLSRFGSASSASVDPLEEEKKKARALRFSGTPVNVNGKLEPKATIAGKAGGEA